MFQVNELITHPSTKEKQVWFNGMHSDVGGGAGPNRGNQRISLGWMADEARQAGLLLNKDWMESKELDVDVLDNTLLPRGVHRSLHVTVRSNKMRNPAMCRDEVRTGMPNLIHRSVNDRMNMIKGWVPPPWCCLKLWSNGSDPKPVVPVRWVSNPSYDAAWRTASAHTSRLYVPHGWHKTIPPQWVKVNLGKFVHEGSTGGDFKHPGAPAYWRALAQSWHSGHSLPLDALAPNTLDKSCCMRRLIHAEKVSAKKVDFGRRNSIILPYEPSVSTMIIVEIQEFVKGVWKFRGRIKLNFDDAATQKLEWHSLDDRSKLSLTLQAKLTYVGSDKAVQPLLGSSDDLSAYPAQCKWISEITGTGLDSLCRFEAATRRASAVRQVANFMGSAGTHKCADFKNEVTIGR